VRFINVMGNTTCHIWRDSTRPLPFATVQTTAATTANKASIAAGVHATHCFYYQEQKAIILTILQGTTPCANAVCSTL
jgi:hypothetical protein